MGERITTEREDVANRSSPDIRAARKPGNHIERECDMSCEPFPKRQKSRNKRRAQHP